MAPKRFTVNRAHRSKWEQFTAPAVDVFTQAVIDEAERVIEEEIPLNQALATVLQKFITLDVEVLVFALARASDRDLFNIALSVLRGDERSTEMLYAVVCDGQRVREAEPRTGAGAPNEYLPPLGMEFDAVTLATNSLDVLYQPIQGSERPPFYGIPRFALATPRRNVHAQAGVVLPARAQGIPAHLLAHLSAQLPFALPALPDVDWAATENMPLEPLTARLSDPPAIGQRAAADTFEIINMPPSDAMCYVYISGDVEEDDSGADIINIPRRLLAVEEVEVKQRTMWSQLSPGAKPDVKSDFICLLDMEIGGRWIPLVPVVVGNRNRALFGIMGGLELCNRTSRGFLSDALPANRDPLTGTGGQLDIGEQDVTLAAANYDASSLRRARSGSRSYTNYIEGRLLALLVAFETDRTTMQERHPYLHSSMEKAASAVIDALLVGDNAVQHTAAYYLILYTELWRRTDVHRLSLSADDFLPYKRRALFALHCMDSQSGGYTAAYQAYQRL